MGKHFILMEVEQWVSQQKGKMPTVKIENDVKWVTGSFISHKTDINMTHKETHTHKGDVFTTRIYQCTLFSAM